jgi:hypothetical protein
MKNTAARVPMAGTTNVYLLPPPASDEGGARAELLLRAPLHPIVDVDGTVIRVGDRVLYSGAFGQLKRATVVALRERGRWSHRGCRLDFNPEVLIRHESKAVSVLQYAAWRVLVLDDKEGKTNG